MWSFSLVMLGKCLRVAGISCLAPITGVSNPCECIENGTRYFVWIKYYGVRLN